MMPQMPNKQMPPAAAGQAATAAAPAAAAPPAQGQPMPPQQGQGGPQPTQNIGFNQEMQNILFSRVNTMNEQEIAILDSIITPETYHPLVKLFPEMKILFEEATALDGYDDGSDPDPITGGGMAGGMGGGGGAAPTGEPQAQAGNPLVDDEKLSRGLMG